VTKVSGCSVWFGPDRPIKILISVLNKYTNVLVYITHAHLRPQSDITKRLPLTFFLSWSQSCRLFRPELAEIFALRFWAMSTWWYV
jgi:hypothetical protein